MIRDIKDKYIRMPIQVKASFWFLICSFLQKGISVISTPIFTRLFTTEEYGRYNVFNSFLSIVTIFVSLSLAGGVYTQGIIKYENNRLVYSSTMQGLSVCLVLMWIVVYVLFHDMWNRMFGLTTIQMMSMLLLIWTSSVFGFWAAEQQALFKYKALIVVTLVVSFLKPVVGIVFVMLADDKVTARILGLLLVELVIYTGLFFIQIKKGSKLFSKKYWMYALGFNLPLIPHYLSQTILNNADRIMIERMTGTSEAGLYSLAYSIALIMTLFNTSLMRTISPWIYRKIKENRVGDIASIVYPTLAAIAIVNLLLIAFAPEAVVIFAPIAYYDAVFVIPPVAMSVYFMYCYDLFAKFAFYYEKTNFIMTASVIGAVLNIIMNYVFINMYGYLAAGYTTLVCYILYSICHYFFMKKVCSRYCDGIEPYNLKKIVGITIIFLIAGSILFATYEYPFIRFCLIGLFFATIIFKKNMIVNMVKKFMILKNI
ncbi:lipopolysaccharide biosynthesis protein [Phocaeicola dorei]|uniref:lipopolysaccharide biosynthesis protein n=1 Tax=Phocaeicola dorei TaxID=357276 RepID=UPI0035648F6C